MRCTVDPVTLGLVLGLVLWVGGYVTVNLLFLSDKVRSLDWHMWRGKTGFRMRVNSASEYDPYPGGADVPAIHDRPPRELER